MASVEASAVWVTCDSVAFKGSFPPDQHEISPNYRPLQPLPVVLGCTGIPHKQRWQTGRDFAGVAEWDKQVPGATTRLFSI
jgi:hypothetical protein